MEKQVIKEQNFNRGWAVKMFKDGEGYTVALFQFSGWVKSWFSFDENKAKRTFKSVCSFVERPYKDNSSVFKVF